MTAQGLKVRREPADEGGVWGSAVEASIERVRIGRRRRRLTYGERQLLRERLAILRRNPRPLAEVAVVTVGICLFELFVLPGSAGYRGFVAGAVAASTVWAMAVRLRTATERGTRGVEGEELSRRLVDAVPHWLAVHDLPLAGRNIDHVVITPLAVLAIETRWWGEASAAVHQGRREAAMAQAEKNARTLKHLLASRDLGFELPVWPVVLSWGPGAEPTELGHVDVVAGEAPGAWITAYQTGAIHGGLASAAHEALLAYQARFDQHPLERGRARAA